MGRILVTDNPSDLLQIAFNPEAEGVLCKRAVPQKLRYPLALMTEGRIFDLSPANLEAHKNIEQTEFFEAQQIAVPPAEQSRYPGLSALWQERAATREMLARLFKTPVGMNNLLVQPVGRKTSDTTPHRDKAVFNENEIASGLSRTTLRYLFIVSHNAEGTGVIPSRHAGNGRPNAVSHAMEYPDCPKNHAEALNAEAHDILVMKTGPEGTVHWAKIPEQVRGWTMYYTELPMNEVDKNLGAKDAPSPHT